MQDMSWTLKNEHVYPGENKNRDTGVEHTYAFERASMKDEGLGDVLESYAGR